MGIVETVLADNFATWLILICTLLVLLDPRFRDSKLSRLFLLYWFILVILDASDIAEYCLSEGMETLSPWRYVTSATNYILNSASVMTFLLILLRRERQKTALTWIIAAPLLIEILLVATSPWTHWVFSFTESNHFVRGPLGYLPFIMSGLYFIVLIVVSFIFSSRFDQTELFNVCILAALVLLATLLELFLSYRFLLIAALSVSCFVYYVHFFIRRSRVDTLTGLYNRQSFFMDSKNLKPGKTILISIDLNGLKALNDGKGHAEGDKALLSLANALLGASRKDFVTYRTGGDEFVVVAFKKNGKDVDGYIARAKELLQKDGYMASFGYASYDEGSSFDEAIRKSDEAMYLDKANHQHR